MLDQLSSTLSIRVMVVPNTIIIMQREVTMLNVFSMKNTTQPFVPMRRLLSCSALKSI